MCIDCIFHPLQLTINTERTQSMYGMNTGNTFVTHRRAKAIKLWVNTETISCDERPDLTAMIDTRGSVMRLISNATHGIWDTISTKFCCLFLFSCIYITVLQTEIHNQTAYVVFCPRCRRIHPQPMYIRWLTVTYQDNRQKNKWAKNDECQNRIYRFRSCDLRVMSLFSRVSIALLLVLLL